MDQIQRTLIKAGHKDLAQEYFDKVAKDGPIKTLLTFLELSDTIDENLNLLPEPRGILKNISLKYLQITDNKGLSQTYDGPYTIHSTLIPDKKLFYKGGKLFGEIRIDDIKKTSIRGKHIIIKTSKMTIELGK